MWTTLSSSRNPWLFWKMWRCFLKDVWRSYLLERFQVSGQVMCLFLLKFSTILWNSLISVLISFSHLYFYLDGELLQEIQVNATPVPPKCTKRKGCSTLIRGKKRKLHFDSFQIQQDDNYPQPPSLELIEASSPPYSLHSDNDDVPPPFLEQEKVPSSPN